MQNELGKDDMLLNKLADILGSKKGFYVVRLFHIIFSVIVHDIKKLMSIWHYCTNCSHQ